MNMGTLQSNALIKAGLIIGVSLVLGLLFDYFFYAKILGVAFPLYVVLVASGLFAVAGFLNKQISKEALLLLAPLIFFSVMVFVRSSALLTLLNIAASLLLLLVIAEVSFDGKLKNFFIADYIKIFLLPFKFILPLFQTLSDLFSLEGVNKDKKVLSQVIKGVVMAVPVLFIFLILIFFEKQKIKMNRRKIIKLQALAILKVPYCWAQLIFCFLFLFSSSLPIFLAARAIFPRKVLLTPNMPGAGFLSL